MPCASALSRNAAIHCSNGMRVFSALAILGSISPANAPAMAFNEARLAMFGDDLTLNAGLALALCFWRCRGHRRVLGGGFRRRCGLSHLIRRKLGHGGRFWRGR